ncbi:MAG: DNA topoisomerase VI subunit B [Candidatus Freyarchaeota archaeon]|nr:DNA topoisomerase VI subunit B [Candidatus Jordarchaeia archaeon]
MQPAFGEISVSDFFYRHRELAGFSNPSRATYMIIREAVENSLDACEEAGVLPSVKVLLNSVERGVYYLRVEDNGFGVPPSEVPFAFGKFLYGSKFGVKQRRGIFGLGISMALLYSQVTSGKPASVTVSNGREIFEIKLRIDIERNMPVVEGRKRLMNKDGWHGSIVELYFKGDYPRAEEKILNYFRLTSIASPHAEVTFTDPSGNVHVFKRSVERIPSLPIEVLPHPHGVDAEMLRRLLKRNEGKSLLSFMVKSFQKVGYATAKKFLESAGFSPHQPTSTLTNDDVLELLEAMKSYDFPSPDARCLSPIGEDALREAIINVFEPEFVAACQRPPAVYLGHPFIVEAAVAYGCKGVEGELALFRFANRIPLLYDMHSDVSMSVLKRFNWGSYLPVRPQAMGVFTHICSTRIPFKTAGKECVADTPEIEREIELALKECCRRLKTYLTGKVSGDEWGRKFNAYRKYLPKIAKFAAELAGRKEAPNIALVLEQISGGKKSERGLA